MCVNYHYDAGYKASFRNYLEYRKLTYKIYEKNMLEQKIDAKKKSSKMNINLQKKKRNFLKQKVIKTLKTSWWYGWISLNFLFIKQAI
ncbi:hypothetical protein [Campylobacter concisus]|uniref:hypothetical protein n=1 Tax=Campylobacter concisus TaxID=199 RepID=UPI00214D6A55|nr:hypothetical protein [Campylobacter concisus]